MRNLKRILIIGAAIIVLLGGVVFAYYRLNEKTIAILLYDDFNMLDAVAAYQTLSGLTLREYRIKFVAIKKGPVESAQHQAFEADNDFQSLTHADILYIPGGENIDRVLADSATMDWIRKIDAGTRYTASTGSGTLLLGAADLLKGKAAATRWQDRAALERLGAAYANANYIQDGKYFTGEGASAAIDMNLEMIHQVDGEWLAKVTQLYLQYDPQPPLDIKTFETANENVLALTQEMGDAPAGSVTLDKTIAILLYPGFTMLDVAGPYQLLNELRAQGYDIKFVAKEKGLVKSDYIQSLRADYSFDEVKEADVLLIPGGTSTFAAMKDDETIAWVQEIDQTTKLTASVCTGSLLLAKAGLLNGRHATSHWYTGKFLPDYGAQYTNQRYTQDGKYLTGAGVSAGIDVGIEILRDLIGDEYAQAAQLTAGYRPTPPFDAGTPEKSTPDAVDALSQMYAGAIQ